MNQVSLANVNEFYIFSQTQPFSAIPRQIFTHRKALKTNRIKIWDKNIFRAIFVSN
jgi:hypothetical protein